MLEAIPLLGPLLKLVTGPIASIINKFQDKQITQIQANQAVDTAAIEQAKAVDANRLSLRIAQDMLLFPTIAWVDLYIWDQIVGVKHPELVWPILRWPTEISYLPYMVAVYLLGATGLVLWNRNK